MYTLCSLTGIENAMNSEVTLLVLNHTSCLTIRRSSTRLHFQVPLEHRRIANVPSLSSFSFFLGHLLLFNLSINRNLPPSPSQLPPLLVPPG